MADTMYAWSPIRNGGEVVKVTDGLGRDRAVVSERNIIPVGAKVAAKDVENYDELVEAGVLRPYPYPEGLDPTSLESPLDFLRRRLREKAEAEMSEEQQLLYATGMGAVVSDEVLATTQPEDTEEIKKAANTK
jgi:hypothetical protein